VEVMSLMMCAVCDIAPLLLAGFSDLWAGMGTGIVPLPFRVPAVALVWATLAIL
jgi:hypothetical protein